MDLILLAMTHPAAVGAAFHSIDEGGQSWHDYFVALCLALDLRMPRWSVPRPVAYPAAALVEMYGKARGYASRPLVTRTAVEIIGTRQGFSTARARQRLGFSPTIGFEEGRRQNGRLVARTTSRRRNSSGPLVRSTNQRHGWNTSFKAKTNAQGASTKSSDHLLWSKGSGQERASKEQAFMYKVPRHDGKGELFLVLTHRSGAEITRAPAGTSRSVNRPGVQQA